MDEGRRQRRPRIPPEEQPAGTRRLATLGEIARYLQVPPKTLYAWRYKGEGPPGYRVGRHVRYRWADVQEWLESRRGRGA